MEFVSVGEGIYWGMQMPLYCCVQEKFENSVVTDRFRILLIESGTGVLGINENRILFNTPAVFCINETEEVILLENTNIKAISIYFSPEVINSSLNFEKIRGDKAGMTLTERNDCTCMSPFYNRSEIYYGQLMVGIGTFKTMQQLFNCLKGELVEQRDSFWPCRSRSFLIELLFLFQRIYFDNKGKNVILLNNNSEFIGQLVLYLHTNYKKKITISDLSSLFNLNRTTLNEKFKNEMGMTAIAYLIDLRIRLSCTLLSDTMLPVAEITERVGFNDVAHFTRTFKNVMGHSPSEYRQMTSWHLK